MPNIAQLLKEEISRLSRKEIRRQVSAVKRMTAQHRRHIAALKREIAKLEKQVSMVARRAGRTAAASPAAASGDGAGMRFVAKGLVSLRRRLGLSAGEFAKLAGVSGQSIYNWENKKAVPRREQVATIASLRALGKKEARARLESLGGAPASDDGAPKRRGRKPGSKARPKAAKTAGKSARRRGRPAADAAA